MPGNQNPGIIFKPKIRRRKEHVARNANTNENNFQQLVSSIRHLKNNLFTDENEFFFAEI